MIIFFSLIFAVVLIAVELLGLVGVPLGNYDGRIARERSDAFRSLNLIADLNKERLLHYLEERRDDARVTAESRLVEDAVSQLREAIREITSASQGDSEIRGEIRKHESYAALDEFLRKVRNAYGVYGRILVADASTGRVLFSTEASDLWRQLPGFPDTSYIQSAAESVVSEMELRKQLHVEFSVSHVIQGRAGRATALLIMDVGVDDIVRPILRGRKGLGRTGEVVLVDHEARNLTSLRHKLADGSDARPLEHQIGAEPAVFAARGEEGFIRAEDYRGEMVLAAYRHIRVSPEFGWGMVVKRDEAELLSGMREDLIVTAVMAVAATFLIVLVTGFLAQRLTAPIRSLSQTADKVAGGDLEARARVTASDEVGALAATFNAMVLQVQTWRTELEARVSTRTAELKQANLELEAEIDERKRAELATRAAQQQLIEQQRGETERVLRELNKVRDQLVNQTRLAAIGQVAAGIAHELRNPLGAARNAAYYLMRYRSRPEPELVEHLGIIDHEIAAADRIIRNLTDMTRAKPPSKQAVDLGRLAQEVLQGAELGEAIAWRVTANPDPFTLEVDPHQLRQVLANLVTNAAQALEGSGEIDVELGRVMGGSEIKVRDSGSGIAAEDRDRLFEPLFTTKAKGTGLGLTICRQIIKRHGGSIDLTDDDQSGTAFRIWLPA